MAEIRFEFDPEKTVQALAYLAKRGVPDLSKLKAAKLLYFCDKFHLLRYGRPVLGDAYFCLDQGPVPSASLNLMTAAIESKDKNPAGPIGKIVDEYLAINREPEYPEFVAKKDPDLDVFSASEIEALEHTVKTYGNKKPWTLIQLTHKDLTWTTPNENRVPGSRADIPYELFFAGQPDDVRQLLGMIEDEQNERDFAERLSTH